MSTTSPAAFRKELKERLNQAIQCWGNLNVLFTHCIASRVGLSAIEFECLSLLRDQGPMTAGRLSKLTGLTSGVVTGLVDRLARADLAERQADSTDRRRVMVGVCPNRVLGDKIRNPTHISHFLTTPPPTSHLTVCKLLLFVLYIAMDYDSLRLKVFA